MALALAYSPRRFSAARLAAKCCLSRPHCTIASEIGLAALTVALRSRSLPVSVSFSAGSSSLGARPSTRATTSRASASFSCRHLANRMAQSSRFKALPSAPQPNGRATAAGSASSARCATVLSNRGRLRFQFRQHPSKRFEREQLVDDGRAKKVAGMRRQIGCQLRS